MKRKFPVALWILAIQKRMVPAWLTQILTFQSWQMAIRGGLSSTLLLVVFLGAAPLQASTAEEGLPTLLVMGDSLSAAYGIEQEQGWVSLLAERLDGDAQVVNASISGETTSGGAQRFADIIGQRQPDIVLLELGGNDGLRGLPPAQMRANLATIIEQSQQAGAEVLLLGIDIPPNYGQAYRDAFTGVYHSLAQEYELSLVPFLLEDIALNQQLMQSDGIHPTADAQPIILDNVWPALEPMLEETYQASSQ
ncbi:MULTISPECIES: arylesterase [unclassified Halomonas]|uniref:arylesterase n=2 Tax=Halomonadaceae TaxID=28256 RepID=UPI001EF4E3C1|nr:MULTISPECIES: arylesterase [unclassified Halomonas]MCG7577138.1 arylesterase [Halomonas sp. MMH1-48]MCG7604203.1 arylesterase [Halomonas sp. MM17-34]MCG7613452.1 arylesterase [Halomonas sp. MM17-29]MCG7620226.1 arylesterase [Halomonas sp. DSH1-27]